jgi:hypothetical protein
MLIFDISYLEKKCFIYLNIVSVIDFLRHSETLVDSNMSESGKDVIPLKQRKQQYDMKLQTQV